MIEEFDAPVADDEALRLLDVPAVADRLHVTEKQVRLMITRGDLAAVKIGRLVRLEDREVDRYIRSLRVGRPS